MEVRLVNMFLSFYFYVISRAFNASTKSPEEIEKSNWGIAPSSKTPCRIRCALLLFDHTTGSINLDLDLCSLVDDQPLVIARSIWHELFRAETRRSIADPDIRFCPRYMIDRSKVGICR
jgi:hypothetical protein